MIEVIRFPLSIDRLRAIPKDERALLFLLGYSAIQISLFDKLVIFSTNKTPADPVEQRVNMAQMQMLARFAIGILVEAWELIRKRFLKSHLGNEFAAELNQLGQTALAELKNHFGSSNLLGTLQNNLAFHYPNDDDIDAAFEKAANDRGCDNDWNWYHTNGIVNCCYFVSKMVVLHAISNAAGETGLIEAHEKILAAVREVSEPMTKFICALSEAILVKNFGMEITTEVAARIEDAPGIFDVRLPFYVEIPPDNPSVGAAQGGA